VAAPPETADFGDALSDLEAFRLIQLADPTSASPETCRAPGNENAGRGASRVESRHARPQPDSCRRLELPTVCHLVLPDGLLHHTLCVRQEIVILWLA
jgi:hypothetical protein